MGILPEQKRAAALAQIKPLEFEELSAMTYRAPAPLFGNIRVESYGDDWHVNWSVPGYCDSFVHGDFIGPFEAMKAAQTRYAEMMLKTICHSGEPKADE